MRYSRQLKKLGLIAGTTLLVGGAIFLIKNTRFESHAGGISLQYVPHFPQSTGSTRLSSPAFVALNSDDSSPGVYRSQLRSVSFKQVGSFLVRETEDTTLYSPFQDSFDAGSPRSSHHMEVFRLAREPYVPPPSGDLERPREDFKYFLPEDKPLVRVSGDEVHHQFISNQGPVTLPYKPAKAPFDAEALLTVSTGYCCTAGGETVYRLRDGAMLAERDGEDGTEAFQIRRDVEGHWVVVRARYRLWRDLPDQPLQAWFNITLVNAIGEHHYYYRVAVPSQLVTAESERPFYIDFQAPPLETKAEQPHAATAELAPASVPALIYADVPAPNQPSVIQVQGAGYPQDIPLLSFRINQRLELVAVTSDYAFQQEQAMPPEQSPVKQ